MRIGVVEAKWAGATLVAGAFAWWATGLRPFSDPALVVVPLGGLVAMGLGAWLLPARTAAPVPLRRLVLWAALAAAVAAWQLATFVQRPRQEHPTMSSMANTLFDSRPTRAIAFLVWLAGAAALGRR